LAISARWAEAVLLLVGAVDEADEGFGADRLICAAVGLGSALAEAASGLSRTPRVAEIQGSVLAADRLGRGCSSRRWRRALW
jgi:hypothetical protein